MVKKAILLLTTGFEEAEALVTADVLRRGGVIVTTASLTNEIIVTGSHDIAVRADALFDDIADEFFDAVILPGGPGTSRYMEHGALPAYIEKAAQDENVLLAAICAAPSVLGGLGLLNGKRATCFPGYEEKLTGAVVTGAAAEEDGRIITGKSAGCAFDFALCVLAYLHGAETSDKIKSAMYYKTAENK